MTASNVKIKLSPAGIIWLILCVLFLAVITAARPGSSVLLAVFAVVGILMHLYLHSPVVVGESFKYVYIRRYAALSVITFLFLPHLIFKMGDLGLVIQYGIPLILLLFANYHALESNGFKFKTHTVNLLIFLVIISILLSTFYGRFVMGVPLSPRDFLEIKAPVYYFLIFNLFFQINWERGDLERFFLRPLLIGGIITAVLGIIQFLHIPGLNESVSAYWTEEGHLRELMKPASRRIFSTFQASGIYGVFLLFIIAHLMGKFLAPEGKNRIGTFFYIVIALTALIMTGTKTSFVLLIALAVMFPFFFYRNIKLRLISSLAMLVAIFLLTAGLWTFAQNSNFVKRLQQVGTSIVNVGSSGTSVRAEDVLDETLIGRYALYKLAEPRIVASPILGWGPGKQFLRTVGFHTLDESEIRFESSYLQILVRYGLVGIFVNFFLLFGYLMSLQWRILKMENVSPELRRIASAHFVFGLLLLLAFFTGDFIYNVQMMAPLYASAGISASFLLHYKSAQKQANTV